MSSLFLYASHQHPIFNSHIFSMNIVKYGVFYFLNVDNQIKYSNLYVNIHKKTLKYVQGVFCS